MCRMRIEYTFGKVFGQWRRIKKTYSLNIELAVDHIVSCLVLNNFMILNGEVFMVWYGMRAASTSVSHSANESIENYNLLKRNSKHLSTNKEIIM